jgi:hypothetical protein
MGLNLSWIATRGLDKAEVLARLGLVMTGQTGEYFDTARSCAELPGDWLIVYANRMDWATPERIAAVSVGGEAVGCQMSETVMWSGAWGCRDGAREWSVTHDPDKDLNGVKVEGDPPSQLPDVMATARRGQERGDDSVDYMFDVPVELVAAVCGFNANELDRGLVFSVLAPEARGGSGPITWLAKLFSGKQSSPGKGAA